MDFFNEIDIIKKDLPKFKAIEKSVNKYSFNGYQIFAIVTFALCFVLGIVLGNLFPSCSSTITLYDTACVNTEFNFFLMLAVWFASLVLCLVIFAIGRIIFLLDSINNKIK